MAILSLLFFPLSTAMEVNAWYFAGLTLTCLGLTIHSLLRHSCHPSLPFLWAFCAVGYGEFSLGLWQMVANWEFTQVHLPFSAVLNPFIFGILLLVAATVGFILVMWRPSHHD